MHILLITQQPPFDPSQVATGNALRTLQLSRALESAGHTVRQVWLDKAGSQTDTFHSADALRGLIRAESAEVLLVSYWELLGLLPFDLEVPVALDFVAPRPLEELFEHPQQLGSNLQRLRVNLARCDVMLTGNAEQEKLLTYWLLEAGFDLRAESCVRVVPLAGPRVEGHRDDPAAEGFTVVGGGVDWPWRNTGDYLQELDQAAKSNPEHLKLALFGGQYPLHQPGQDSQSPNGLVSYAEYSDFLSKQAHIGLELGADNIERRHSQSFRSLDFLRHGLPLVCNSWLPIAKAVREHDAGWMLDEPGQVQELFARILNNPEEWKAKQVNAGKLADQFLDPAKAAAPLLEWLEQPRKATRLPGYGLPAAAPPVLGKPPLSVRLKRRWRLARRVLLARLFGSHQATGAVVMVSRGDVFPADHGAAVKIIETARGLSRNGVSAALVTDSRRHWWKFVDGKPEQQSLPFYLRLLSRPLAWVKLDHYTRDIPESNAFLYLPLTDTSFFWRTLWVSRRIGASTLQAEFPAYAKPCVEVGEILSIPATLVEHNVEYQRLRAQVPELSDQQFEWFRDVEIYWANRCQAVICVSDNDRQQLAADGVHPGLLHTVPHGIDLQSVDSSTAADARSTYDIPAEAPLLAYHGTFAYPPNRDALAMLAREILPRLESRDINAHVLAIGHQPPEPPHPRIHCTGSVEQIPPWLKAADLAVIPLREGGGTRMKIIDCFAAGLPVISTSKGIEGIPAIDGKHALIRDDWDTMTDAIADLLSHPDQAAQLAANARTYAESLDWSAIGRQYLEIYQDI